MATGNQRIELADPDAYKRLLFERVGDRDPLEVCAETPGALRELVEGVSRGRLARHPEPGKWSVLEVLGHYVDCEWVFGQRTRAIACDDRPVLVGIDQDRWVATLDHQSRDAADLLDDFSALRRINVAQWRQFDDALLDRVGRHAERGDESLRLMRTLVAGHDLHHLAQIDALLAN